MLTILLTIITSSAARTTYSPVNIENNSKHRSFLPVLDVNLNFGSSNGRQWIPTYSYPAVYESVKLSDVFQGHSSNVNRSANPTYSIQYPYENGNGQWNRQTVTEVSQLNDRFDNNRNEDDVLDYIKTQTTEKPEVIQYNRRDNNSKDNSKQPHDVNTNYSNNYTRKYQTTTEKVQTNFNRTNKPNINPVFVNNNNSKTNHSSTNSYHSSIENTKNTDNKTKTDMFTFKPDNNTLNANNSININDYNNYTTKTAQENEVTSTHEARLDSNDDRWVWSNSEVPETTTLVALDDRAAFAGGSCPSGTVRFQNRCIDVD